MNPKKHFYTSPEVEVMVFRLEKANLFMDSGQSSSSSIQNLTEEDYESMWD